MTSPFSDNIGLRKFDHLTAEERRIPLIDFRRIHKFGWCKPCSETSYLDDTHSYGCPLKASSESWLELVTSG